MQSSSILSNSETAVLAAMIGAVVATALNYYLQSVKVQQEHRSLLLFICKELVFNYERCVIYANQAKDGVVSFSGIFHFIDSSAVSRFVAVSESPELISAIMNLKFTFFQVGRHVENASKLAYESQEAERELFRQGSFGGDIDDQKFSRLQRSASQSQGVAIAFFTGAPDNSSKFDEVDRDMEIVVEATRRECPGRTADDLHRQFEEKRRELRPFRPAEK